MSEQLVQSGSKVPRSGLVSESNTCFGVDIQSTVTAKGEKLVRLNYGSKNLNSLGLRSFLKLFRQSNPLAETRGHVLDTSDFTN